MPSYNSSKFIGEAIESVIAQSYSNWELLIVDDCSYDNTPSIVNKYVLQDSRIKLVVLSKNMGAAFARNISLDNANGRFIAFLDSDDIWMPNKLEQQLSFMMTNRYAFSFSNYGMMLENGYRLKKVIKVPEVISYRGYLRNTIIGCLTVMIDKSVVGDFRMPIIKSSHDMALWLHILKRGYRAYGLKENLAMYRLVSRSNTAKKWKAAMDVWKVYREEEKLSIIYSAYNFCGYVFNAVLKRL